MIPKAAQIVAEGIREARAGCAAHYDGLASEVVEDEHLEGILIAQNRIADRFRADNPNFDRRCFDLACDPDARTVSKS